MFLSANKIASIASHSPKKHMIQIKQLQLCVRMHTSFNFPGRPPFATCGAKFNLLKPMLVALAVLRNHG